LEAPKYKREAPIMGVWKRSPQGPGAESLVRGTGVEVPMKLKILLAFGRSLKAANLPTFKEIGNAKKSDTVCVVFAKNEV